MRPVEGNRLLADPYFYRSTTRRAALDLAIAIHIANGSPWLSDLYNHPVRIAGTLHKFEYHGRSFNDVVLSEIPQVFPKAQVGFIELAPSGCRGCCTKPRTDSRTLGAMAGKLHHAHTGCS